MAAVPLFLLLDLTAGGTWLGISRRRRFATVTNFRDAKPTSPDFRSRGELVTNFVAGAMSPRDYLATVEQTGAGALQPQTQSSRRRLDPLGHHVPGQQVVHAGLQVADPHLA